MTTSTSTKPTTDPAPVKRGTPWQDPKGTPKPTFTGAVA